MDKIRKAVFIDGSFLFHHSQNIQIKIDYFKLKNLLVSEDEFLTSIAYYTALPKEADMEQRHRSFIKVLKKEVRIKVKSVPLLKVASNSVTSEGGGPRYSKGEDILLAGEMVRGAALNHYDIAVLVTGDGDFVPAVRIVQELGKPVVIASFRSSLNHTLDLEGSKVIYLDEYIKEIRLP